MPLRKILFFIATGVPTQQELDAAAKLNTRMFRNASQVSSDEKPEACTHVTGIVPVPSIYFTKEGEPVKGVAVIKLDEHGNEVTAPVATGGTSTGSSGNGSTVTLVATGATGSGDAGNGGGKPAVVMTEKNTIAQIMEALAGAGIEIPAGVTKKADLLALFPATE